MSIEKCLSRDRTPAECYVNKTEHKQKDQCFVKNFTHPQQETGRQFQTQRGYVRIIEGRKFQFPSNGKAVQNTFVVGCGVTEVSEFQFPSNGKAVQNKPFQVFSCRFRESFNSLQTGRQFKTLKPAPGRCEKSLCFNSLQTGRQFRTKT